MMNEEATSTSSGGGITKVFTRLSQVKKMPRNLLCEIKWVGVDIPLKHNTII